MRADPTPSVLVAGAGIAGLATAVACLRAGWQPQVLERVALLSEVGAGIQMGPNVTRTLRDLGLLDAVVPVAAFPQQLQVRNAHSGEVLATLRLHDMASRYGAPYATIHRADLHALLRHAAHALGVQLCTGEEVVKVQQTSAFARVQTATGRAFSAPLLVGADGLWSRVRQHVLGEQPPVSSGHLAYRALVPQSTLPAKLRSQQITVWMGPRFHVVQYPVRGGESLNLVAIVHGQVEGDMTSWDHSANAADLLLALMGAHPALMDLLRAVPAWRLWPLYARPPMRSASEHGLGRVMLVGDAAHPMRPYLAQGAGMAIEDAAALALALQATRHDAALLPAAVQQFAHARWARNARVQARSQRNGEVFHMQGPMGWARDASLRLAGAKLLDVPWLYKGP